VPELVELVREVPERDNKPKIALESEVKDEEYGEWREDEGVVKGVEMDAVERLDEVVVDGVLVKVVVVVEVVEASAMWIVMAIEADNKLVPRHKCAIPGYKSNQRIAATPGGKLSNHVLANTSGSSLRRPSL
jgi:hypothetical protein